MVFLDAPRELRVSLYTSCCAGSNGRSGERISDSGMKLFNDAKGLFENCIISGCHLHAMLLRHEHVDQLSPPPGESRTALLHRLIRQGAWNQPHRFCKANQEVRIDRIPVLAGWTGGAAPRAHSPA